MGKKRTPEKPLFLQIAVDEGIVTRQQACRAFLHQQRLQRIRGKSNSLPIGELLRRSDAITGHEIDRVLEIQDSTKATTDSLPDPISAKPRRHISLRRLLNICALPIVFVVFVISEYSIGMTSSVIGIITYLSESAKSIRLPSHGKQVTWEKLAAVVTGVTYASLIYALANLYVSLRVDDVAAHSHVVRAVAALAIVCAAFFCLAMVSHTRMQKEWYYLYLTDSQRRAVDEALGNHESSDRDKVARLLAFVANQIATTPYDSIKKWWPKCFLQQPQISVWLMVPVLKNEVGHKAKQDGSPSSIGEIEDHFVCLDVADFGLGPETRSELNRAKELVVTMQHNEERFRALMNELDGIKDHTVLSKEYQRRSIDRADKGEVVSSLTGYVFKHAQQKDVSYLPNCRVYQWSVIEDLKREGCNTLASLIGRSSVTAHPVFSTKNESASQTVKAILLVFQDAKPRGFTYESISLCELTSRCLGAIDLKSLSPKV